MFGHSMMMIIGVNYPFLRYCVSSIPWTGFWVFVNNRLYAKCEVVRPRSQTGMSDSRYRSCPRSSLTHQDPVPLPRFLVDFLQSKLSCVTQPRTTHGLQPTLFLSNFLVPPHLLSILDMFHINLLTCSDSTYSIFRTKSPHLTTSLYT